MKTMRRNSKLSVGNVARLAHRSFLAAGLFLISCLPAQAALLQDLDLGFTSGVVEFPNDADSCGALTFEDDIDLLDALADCEISFGFTLFAYADWNIDPNTWLLDLEALIIGAGALGYDIVDGTGVGCEVSIPPGEPPIVFPIPLCDGGIDPFQASAIPIHEAPEPSALALFVVALGGLGFMARRRLTA